MEALEKLHQHIAQVPFPCQLPQQYQHTNETSQEWFNRADFEILQPGTWQNLDRTKFTESQHEAARECESALKSIWKKINPPAYYAVLALDGDQFGRWISGGFLKTCKVEDQKHQFLAALGKALLNPVSYTHLTLPTIYSV